MACSSPTARTSALAPARVELYSDTIGSGRAPVALVNTTICPLPAATIGGRAACRAWNTMSRLAAFTLVPLRERRFEEAAGDDLAGDEARRVEPAEALQRRGDDRFVALAGGQVDTGDDLDGRTELGQFVEQRPGVGLRHHRRAVGARHLQDEIVAGTGEQAGEWRPDVAGGECDQGDASVGHGHTV